MDIALLLDRLQFGFTISFHYLFPQLTMGLSLLIVVLKAIALKTGDTIFDDAARFWARIFALNFAVGVVTGIPMEFQFGTNWARFSKFAGGVIGQTLAMEGMFAFFLESSFLGLFLFAEKRLGRIVHFAVSILVFLGSWLSGFLIVATNAWMQNPVAYEIAADGTVRLTNIWGLLFNPWVGWQYPHTMAGAVVTSAFVMAAVGAYYLLARSHEEHAKVFVRVGVLAGLVATAFVLFPTGDGQGRIVAEKQPVTLAAMEGLFTTKEGAELILIGQPDMQKMKMDNPVHIPRLLSFLTYRHWNATVKGLDAFPPSDWPDNIPLLYYCYHIMVGLGTMFLAVMALAGYLLVRHRLYTARAALWLLMLGFPFPFIANTAGWMTAELGRQPWVVYGLMRTANASSHVVSSGNTLFTLLGFCGMYLVIGVLFIILVVKEINQGPARAGH